MHTITYGRAPLQINCNGAGIPSRCSIDKPIFSKYNEFGFWHTFGTLIPYQNF